MFEDELRVLRDVVERAEPGTAWRVSAAAVQLLWWSDDFDAAGELAERTLTRLAGSDEVVDLRTDSLDDALLARVVHGSGTDVTDLIRQLRETAITGSVLAERMAFLEETLPNRPLVELLPGYQWNKPTKPFRRSEQALLDQGLSNLEPVDLDKLWHAAHSRRHYPLALDLIAHNSWPTRWYYATWIAGCLVTEDRRSLASEIVEANVAGWHPFDLWDLVPTDVVLQPRLRETITDTMRQRIRDRVDWTALDAVRQ